MKNTGMVRKIDDLGRVVIPVELRNSLGISNQDPLEIYVDGEKIVLTKKVESCVFCSSKENLTTLKNRFVCLSCLNDIN